jgi:hypothetical protein
VDGIEYPPNDLKLDAMESVASLMTIVFLKSGLSFIHGHKAQNHTPLLDQQLSIHGLFS